MTLSLQHPFSMIIAAPSNSGKSHFVAKLLKHRQSMISPSPVKVYWCYSEWQQLYQTIDNVQFHQGIIYVDSIDSGITNLVILDDLMSECDQRVSDIFTKHSHHRNLSVIFMTQNLYHKGPHMRNMNLNSSYIVLFKNPRDVNQINFLSRQMYPSGKSKFMVEAYSDATSAPYGYLLIDLKQSTDDAVRLRTCIFPDEKTYIYVSKEIAKTLRYQPSER